MKKKGPENRKNEVKRPPLCRPLKRSMISRSLGNRVCKNRDRNQCPYRRFGVDTEFPYRLFSLILCRGESVGAELSHWFWRHMGVDTEFPYRVPIVERGTIAVSLFADPVSDS